MVSGMASHEFAIFCWNLLFFLAIINVTIGVDHLLYASLDTVMPTKHVLLLLDLRFSANI